METKDNKKVKSKNKIKREISIITVFLWIFLIFTMILVLKGNIKNTNALEDTMNSYNVKKSAFSEFYPNKNVYNFVKDNKAQTGKGEIELDLQNTTARDIISTNYYGENYVGIPMGYYDIRIKENSNERVATVNFHSEYDKLVVEFEAGDQAGLTTIVIEYSISDLYIKVGNAKETVTKDCISGELEYKVTNSIDDNNDTLYSGITTNKAITANVGDTDDKFFSGYFYSDNDIFYPRNIVSITTSISDSSVAEVVMNEIREGSKKDRFGFTQKGIMTSFKALSPGKTTIVITSKYYIYQYDDSMSNYKIVKKMGKHTYDITVVGEEKVDVTFENDEDEFSSKVKLDKNEKLLMPAKMSNKDWCKVIGWSTTPNSEYADYYVGEEYTFSDDTTLYPVWENFQSINTTIVANKIWDDNNNFAKKRPESVTLQLKTGGEIVEEQEVNEESGWSYTFLVQKYEKNGEEVVYTVDEKESNDLYVKNIVGYTVTNRFVVPEDKVKILGKKIWEDKDDLAKKRDLSVILQLKVGEEVISEGEVSELSNWSYEFEAKKYDELGNEIEYYIDEKETGKFYEKELTDNRTVTNRFKIPSDEVMIKVTKVWEDNEDEYKKRPKNVVLQVFNGEDLVAEEVVDEDVNWSHEFKLPKYDELGNEIKYRVDEKETAKYYEKEVDGNTITNKCIYNPALDTSDINIYLYIGVLVVAIVVTLLVIMFIKRMQK